MPKPETPLLELRGLRKRFPRRAASLREALRRPPPLHAVDGVSLAVRAGETLALVGESGSGKTTTGRMVNLLERPSAGRILFEGADVTELRGAGLKAYRRHVQMVFQNPWEALDPRYDVLAAVAEPLRLQGVGSGAEHRARVEALLEAVDLRPAAAFLRRLPASLSGGQLQRVAIARALILQPRMLVADEPVSALDVSVQAGTIALLLDLQARLGMATLTITHDIAVARLMAHRIAVMYAGRIVEQGPTEALLARPAHPYTRLLISAVPDGRPGTMRPRVRIPASTGLPAAGCRFAPLCPVVLPHCRTEDPADVLVGPEHHASCFRTSEIAVDPT